jgi:hypothetical protein
MTLPRHDTAAQGRRGLFKQGACQVRSGSFSES